MTQETFSSLIETELNYNLPKPGQVVTGSVVGLKNSMVMVDIGLKSEGWIPYTEFVINGKEELPEEGSKIDVYIEKFENRDGVTILSREKARQEENWIRLEEIQKNNQPIDGEIVSKVRSGYIVNLDGTEAFLPSSQADIRPIKDIEPITNVTQPFKIIKMNKLRGNIVVSRRAILEDGMIESKSEFYENIKEGQVLEGVIKNITDYGAFVDLGGIDGLLHVTDISWSRISHPSELLNVGQTIKAVIIKYSEESKRVSLGMKQLQADPWENIEEKYPIGSKQSGVISNITDYGAFIKIDDGIEGLIHVSEMSWGKKKFHPSKMLDLGQTVELEILEIDREKRRISLGMKQLTRNPWSTFESKYVKGDVLTGTVRNITDFGIFISIDNEIDGMVHQSDVSWNRSECNKDYVLEHYPKGSEIKVKLLELDLEKERITFGIKQLSENPFDSKTSKLNKGQVYTCLITQITEGGLKVEIENGIMGFIKRSELSKNRAEQQPKQYASGEKIDAKLLSVDKNKQEIMLSIKAREISEMKEAMKTYGSTDAGASLGEILGDALKEKEVRDEQSSVTKAKKDESTKDASSATETEQNKADSSVKDKSKADSSVKDKSKAENTETLETPKSMQAKDQNIDDNTEENEKDDKSKKKNSSAKEK